METINIPASFQNKVTSFLEARLVIYQFLRFVCIGFLNTALNFLILNTLSKALGISQGFSLGAVGVVGFSAAVIQSYLWNRTWTFGSEVGVSLWRNVVRLIFVGLLGFLGVIFVFVGSRFSAPWLFYLTLLIVYLVFEAMLWRHFGFHMSDWDHAGHSFLIFFVVTLVGLGINISLISVISSNLHLTHTDLDKNIAAALATLVSLFWNFVGYKVFVFKK